MRFSKELEQWRVISGPYGTTPFQSYGKFFIPGPCGRDLQIIASSGDKEMGIDWEHVSVSLSNRCPNWPEMCYIKSLFWDSEETVMQLHPPESQWINNHNYCLHLWKPLNQEIPMPPHITVGNKEMGTLNART